MALERMGARTVAVAGIVNELQPLLQESGQELHQLRIPIRFAEDSLARNAAISRMAFEAS